MISTEMNLKSMRHLRRVSLNEEDRDPRAELWDPPIVISQENEEEPGK